MIPFVSVVVPVYNAEKYLRECLDSVVDQSLREIEIICVDDGSTDSSPQILAEYAARDPRVRVISQENAGVGPARNAGIRAARGEFVAFLDPDDLLPDEKTYEALYLWAKEKRVRVCGGGLCSLANDGKRYFPDASWGSNADQAFPRDGFVRFADRQFDYGFYRYIFERKMLVENEIFFPPYIRYQDPVFCARALDAAGTFYALRRPTYVFRDWHTPDYTVPRRVCDQLRGVRDLLAFSRERGYAKLHWLQIHRLFEEFKPHVLALVKREKSGEHVPADQSAIALLKEIDASVSFPLAWQHKADYPFRFLREEFGIQDCFPPIPDAPFPQDTVDCAFITDDGYVNMTAVAINSIRRSRAPETKVRIHVVAAALSEYSEKVFKLFEEKDFSVEIIRVEKAVLDKLATLHKAKERGHCMATPAALLKFSLPELLPNLNRVLYLDGDVLVRRDLGELFCKFLGHCYAAVVTDAWVLTSKVPKVQKFKKWLFNSGMMLLNLALLRSRRMSETLLEEKRKSTDFSLMDQTIFNMCFAGNVCFLDFRDNFLPVWYYQNSRKIGSVEFFERFHEICGTKIHPIQEILNDDVRIVHFAGTQKPWENNEIPFACEWMACKDEFLEIKKEALIQGRLKVAPFVSVVIPVHNVEKYLRRCLDSVVNQTLKEIEIVCVDDGSTDSSSRILEEYAAKDSRIKVIEQVNAGAAKARDAGIQFSRGKYIGFVDADDYIDSDFYEKLFGAAVKNGLAIAKADLKRVLNGVVEETTWSANSFIEKKQGELPLFARFHYQFTSAIYDSDLLKKNKICFADEKFLVGEDVLFLLKVCQKEESVVLVPDVFYYYVKNESSVTHIFSKAYFDDNLNYVGRGIDLLNARGIYDVGYYSWIHGRFVQMLKVVLPQINENPELSNYKPEFLARIHALAAKVNEKEKLYKNFLNEIPLYELLVEVDYPLVSVVVPVYNVEKYLRECLDSICGQTLKNIEIICVNDGSTDGSPAILEEYASKDSRMRIISQENRGLSAARNAGLSVARGKYIYFMDSDDVSPQDALGKMFAEMEKNSLDVLLFGAESFFESEDLEKAHPVYKTLYKRRPFEAQSGQSLVLAFKNAGCGFSPSACCYCSSREFLNENSIRFPEGILYEDNVFFWKMILSAKRAKSISDALFRRRVRAGSTMTNKKISFRNFKSYATVVFELEKLKEKFLGAAIVEVLRGYARGTSETLVRFYREISMEDRARSRELLSGELKDSAWLDGVRERVAKIDAEKKEICVDTRESAVKPSGRRAGNVASPMVLPRFVVRLGALFILNKAARKRWRERHMDLTPRDGIDVNAHPELRRDSALKRFAVRAASLFIFSKKKRKAFRTRHLNLTPRDGVDVRALSSRELARLREAKRSRSVLRRVFDALVPATRGKIAHAERHLLRATEEQTRILLDELRRVREDAAETRRELARMREEQERSREELLLRTLALKRSARDAEENLQARLEQVSERMKTALERGKIDKIEKTADRMEAWLDYSLLGDALPGFREKLRESIPTASRESLDELFRTGTDSPCVADCRNRLAARIRSAFSYKDAAYYERVPVAERERELKLWFKLRSGCDLDLENPKTFNEKIQWLKLYDSTPLKTRLADKYEARAWIKEKIGEKYLIPLLGVWDSFDEIDFDKLPEKFVLKTTHGSGYNVVVKDKSKFDKAEAKKKITDWLSRKFEYQGGFEMHYAGIKPRVIAEEFLDIDESGAYEWQAFCFNGKPKFILVIEGGAHAGVPGRRYYYDTDWKKLPFTSLADSLPEGEIEMPERFSEFMDCAKKLAADFLHVRVDFYLLRDGSWKAGELTFTTASGQMRIYPKSYDRVIGDMLELPTDRP